MYNTDGEYYGRFTMIGLISGSNLCSVGNGGCSHLCLARLSGRTCVCPDKPTQLPCYTCEFGFICNLLNIILSKQVVYMVLFDVGRI